MNCFLYFLPGGRPGIKGEDIAGAGLSYAFEREGHWTTGEVRAGPDGSAGLLVVSNHAESGPNYHADRQIWQQVPGVSGWVGMARDGRPGPDDLARGQMLKGQWVELGDGAEWLVPLARGLSAEDDELLFYTALPAARTIGEDGNWKHDGVVPRYRSLWDVASRYWDAVTGAMDADKTADEGLAFDFAGETDAAVLALQANYRLSAVEASMLALLDDLTVGKVLNATVDFDRAMEWLKKKVAAGGETTAAG